MLVLSRKLREQIQIGDNVTITVLRIKGNTVRIGIDAPQDVRVVRGELPPKREIREVAVFRSHPERDEVIEITSGDPRDAAERVGAEHAAASSTQPTRSPMQQSNAADEASLPGARFRGRPANGAPQSAPNSAVTGAVTDGGNNRLHDLVQSVTGLETPLS